MARDLTAANQYISFTSVTGQNSLTSITISAWIRPDSKGFDAGDPYGRIFQKNGRFSFYVDGDVSPTFGFTAGFSTRNGDWGATYGSLGSFGTLHHVAVTYNSSSTTNDPILYLDAAAQTLAAYDINPIGTINSDGTNLMIGATSSGSGDYDGLIAEVAVWNRVLSADEIAILSDAFSPAFIPNGLVFYAPLMGNYSPEIDLRYGTTGSFTGTAKANHPRIIYPGSTHNRWWSTNAVTTSIKDLIGGFGFIPFSR